MYEKTRSFHLLTSAIVEVFDSRKNTHKCRTLLDTCSSGNFITEEFVKKLNLKKSRCDIPVSALNDLNLTIKHKVTATFKSTYNNSLKTLEFLIVPNITDSIPSEYIKKDSIKIPQNIRLADPEFYKPSAIDMLIGSGPTLSLLSIGQINLSENGNELYLQKTQLGWILGGDGQLANSNTKIKCMHMLAQDNFDFEKFWRIEERENKRIWSKDDKSCEEHFK